MGYARVSNREQNPEAQEAELHAAGVSRVFIDHGESSRVKAARSGSHAWVACAQATRSWCVASTASQAGDDGDTDHQ